MESTSLNQARPRDCWTSKLYKACTINLRLHDAQMFVSHDLRTSIIFPTYLVGRVVKKKCIGEASRFV